MKDWRGEEVCFTLQPVIQSYHLQGQLQNLPDVEVNSKDNHKTSQK